MARLRVELLTDDCPGCHRERRCHEAVFDLDILADRQEAEQLMDVVNTGIRAHNRKHPQQPIPEWKLPVQANPVKVPQ